VSSVLKAVFQAKFLTEAIGSDKGIYRNQSTQREIFDDGP
jgi:hypothetical protein